MAASPVHKWLLPISTLLIPSALRAGGRFWLGYGCQSGPPVLGEVIVILAARKIPWITGYAQRGGEVRGSFFENLSDS